MRTKNKKIKIKNRRWDIVNSMFVSLMFTGAIIEFSQVGAGLIDGLIISRYLGAEAMAAEGIAHPIFSIVGVISGLIAVSMQVKCSQLIGRGNVNDVNRFFSASVIAGIVISVALAMSVVIFARPFAALLGASGNGSALCEPAAQYLIGLGSGIPALAMIAILGPAIQLDSGRKVIQMGAIIESVSDIVLDIIAVNMGWGIMGIGFATSIACYLDLIYVCLHFLKKDRMLHFIRPNISIKEFIIMLSNGTEKAFRRLANVIRPIILNTVIISYGGTMALSALSVRNNFTNFSEILGSGIAAAVSLLAGLYYGEINEEAITEVKKCEWKYTAIFSTILCIGIFVFSNQIAGLYITENGEIKKMVVFAIRMLALSTPLHVLVQSRISYLQVINRHVNMTVFIFASQLIFVILSALVLGRMFGAYGILSCFLASDALSLVSIYVFYAIKHKRIDPGTVEILNLPEHFYLGPGDVISLDIKDLEDVSLGSEQIQLFCKGHKIDSKVGLYAAIAFEELSGNIIQHGFPNNKKKNPIIDFRMIAADNKLVLRLRDDCPQFNITKFIAEARVDEDPLAHLGIKIASKVAKNMEYTHAFETNNIIITYDLASTNN